METRKVNLDRKPLDTEYIQSKQNFQDLLSKHKISHIPVWKKPLFYGAIGLSCVAGIVLFQTAEIQDSNLSKPSVLSAAVNNNEIEVPVVRTAAVSNSTEKPTSTNSEKLLASHDTKIEDVCYTKRGDEPVVEATSVEVKNPPVAVAKRKSNIPNIGGFQEGSISAAQLCKDPVIRLENENAKVLSFKFQYTGGLEEVSSNVKGNKLPDELCESLKKGSAGNMIFITEILASDGARKFEAPSMNFLLVGGE